MVLLFILGPAATSKTCQMHSRATGAFSPTILKATTADGPSFISCPVPQDCAAGHLRRGRRLARRARSDAKHQRDGESGHVLDRVVSCARRFANPSCTEWQTGLVSAQPRGVDKHTTRATTMSMSTDAHARSTHSRPITRAKKVPRSWIGGSGIASVGTPLSQVNGGCAPWAACEAVRALWALCQPVVATQHFPPRRDTVGIHFSSKSLQIPARVRNNARQGHFSQVHVVWTTRFNDTHDKQPQVFATESNEREPMPASLGMRWKTSRVIQVFKTRSVSWNLIP
jgi:hypothetical protein